MREGNACSHTVMIILSTTKFPFELLAIRCAFMLMTRFKDSQDGRSFSCMALHVIIVRHAERVMFCSFCFEAADKTKRVMKILSVKK